MSAGGPAGRAGALLARRTAAPAGRTTGSAIPPMRDAAAHREPGPARAARIAASRQDHRAHARRAAARHPDRRGFRRLSAADPRTRSAGRISSTSSACRRRPRPACRSCRCSRSSIARTSRRADPTDPQAWYSCSPMASRLMYADRDKFVARPGVHPVPVRWDARAALHCAPRGADRREARTCAGSRRSSHRSNAASMRRTEASGTSHFVVVDRDGNIASMTTHGRIAVRLGPRGGRLHAEQPAHGFLVSLRSWTACRSQTPSPGGKRPRSSMSPVIVLDAKRKASSPRSDRRAARRSSPTTRRRSSRLLGLEAAAAAGHRPAERDRARGRLLRRSAEDLRPASRMRSPRAASCVKPGRGEESGLHGLVIDPDGTATGAADPRREGVWPLRSSPD